MSGETEESVSAWTIDSLHSHLKQMMDERDRRYQERFDERDRRYEQRFDAQEKAVATANNAAEKRFDAVNEFRQQQADIVANYMPRKETEQRIKQVDDKVEASAHVRAEAVAVINSRLDVLSGKSSGSAAVIGYIFGAAAAGAAVAAIITAIVK